jgi:hypothetical protein
VGTEYILVDHDRGSWFDLGKNWQPGPLGALQGLDRGRYELVDDCGMDETFVSLRDNYTFVGCRYSIHSGCSHPRIDESRELIDAKSALSKVLDSTRKERLLWSNRKAVLEARIAELEDEAKYAQHPDDL